MSAQIREATPADAQQIRELVCSLSHFYLDPKDTDNKDLKKPELPHWFADTLTLEAFKARISSTDNVTGHLTEYANFVYEQNNEQAGKKIVGYIAIKNPNHVYHLFVLETLHKQGIGKKLWQHTVNALSLNKQNSITLRASINAVPFYTKLGFKTADTVKSKDGICYQPMQLNMIENINKKHY